MKYTIEGFSQKVAKDLGLDALDLIILRWFVDFKDSGNMRTEFINGEKYYWIRHKKLTDELPILSMQTNAFYRRLRKICESLNREVSFVNGSGRLMYAYECVDNSVTFVQYQAGAMGGNYQKANKIVYFTLPLGKGSCDLWEQSKKRIHRIGQNRPCYYYYLLVKGSFEERNLAALQEGKELTDELFT